MIWVRYQHQTGYCIPNPRVVLSLEKLSRKHCHLTAQISAQHHKGILCGYLCQRRVADMSEQSLRGKFKCQGNGVKNPPRRTSLARQCEVVLWEEAGWRNSWGHLPPFDSKLGMPCMMTWWRKRGLLFILILPERSPLK